MRSGGSGRARAWALRSTAALRGFLFAAAAAAAVGSYLLRRPSRSGRERERRRPSFRTFRPRAAFVHQEVAKFRVVYVSGARLRYPE